MKAQVIYEMGQFGPKGWYKRETFASEADARAAAERLSARPGEQMGWQVLPMLRFASEEEGR